MNSGLTEGNRARITATRSESTTPRGLGLPPSARKRARLEGGEDDASAWERSSEKEDARFRHIDADIAANAAQAAALSRCCSFSSPYSSCRPPPAAASLERWRAFWLGFTIAKIGSLIEDAWKTTNQARFELPELLLPAVQRVANITISMPFMYDDKTDAFTFSSRLEGTIKRLFVNPIDF